MPRIAPLSVLAAIAVSIAGHAFLALPSTAAGQVAVPGKAQAGGATGMSPARTMVENVRRADLLKTLNRLLPAAGLTPTLSGAGPFTLFAPNDDAFARMAPGVVDHLLKPAQREALARLLRYHVVAGRLDAAALRSRIAAGGGRATLTTLAGDPLTLTIANGALVLTDAAGNKSYGIRYDVAATNGVVHVVNGVVIPKLD